MIKRVEQNDPKLTELVILPTKTFGTDEVNRLAVALGPNGCNTYLKTISASGHLISSSDALTNLGRAIAVGSKPRGSGSDGNGLTSLAIGNSTMGDVGICALCDGLRSGSSNDGGSQCDIIKLENLDLSYKGM